MAVLIIVLFALINIVLACIDAKKILLHQPINHPLNAIVYVGLMSLVYFLYRGVSIDLVIVLVALLFTRQIFFDITLSLYRGLKWDYVTLVEKPGSVIDGFEKKIFGTNGKLKYGVYGIILILLIVSTFIW